jgi:hypothetical protein
MQVRGILKNANRVAIPAGGFSLCGNIFDDAKGQYRDGWYVYTAKVLEEIEPNVFKTATGNIYRIESWKPPSKPTSEYEILPADWPFFPKDE